MTIVFWFTEDMRLGAQCFILWFTGLHPKHKQAHTPKRTVVSRTWWVAVVPAVYILHSVFKTPSENAQTIFANTPLQ